MLDRLLILGAIVLFGLVAAMPSHALRGPCVRELVKAPRITGKAIVGHRLHASHGTWRCARP